MPFLICTHLNNTRTLTTPCGGHTEQQGFLFHVCCPPTPPHLSVPNRQVIKLHCRWLGTWLSGYGPKQATFSRLHKLHQHHHCTSTHKIISLAPLLDWTRYFGRQHSQCFASRFGCRLCKRQFICALSKMPRGGVLTLVIHSYLSPGPHPLCTATLLWGFRHHGNRDISSMPVVRFCLGEGVNEMRKWRT